MNGIFYEIYEFFNKCDELGLVEVNNLWKLTEGYILRDF
jgi:hypothetical protein